MAADVVSSATNLNSVIEFLTAMITDDRISLHPLGIIVAIFAGDGPCRAFWR